jgi:endonuclease I
MKTKLLLLSLFIAAVCATWAQGPNNSGTYYQGANGKSGQSLRAALASIIAQNHSVVSYDGLITAYELTDTRPDGYVRDWYSCTTNYRHGKDTGGYKKEGDSYNREHSVPQSWFSKRSPMKSDIVHVVPTDGYVNNRRSSFPFGEVGNVTYRANQDYCRLGSSKTPGYSGTVFEVPDEVKGDMARIYFYMATRYKDQCGNWGGGIFTSDGMVKWELDQMLAWSRQDPVDNREIARNNAVQEVQKNRNPFVDYPGLEEYIWGTKKDQTFSYDQYNGGTLIDVPTVAMPTFTPDAGTYIKKVEITMSCATEGAKIYYTTNGADASEQSLLYTGPITLTQTSTIKAVAVKDGQLSYQNSAFYMITSEQQGDDIEPEDGEIELNADFFETSYTGTLPATDVQDLEGTENGITVVYAKGTGDYRYANGSEIRVYKGNTLTVSVGQGTLTEIEFTTGKKTAALNADEGSVSDYKWTGNANKIVFTSGGTLSLAKMKVSVVGGTDIREVQTNTLSGKRVIYNLRGQRVANPTHGIYIVDGKKVVIE